MSGNGGRKKFLSLLEAWELIPRFDGKNINQVDSVINAIMWVAERINPVRKPDLLHSILETKMRGDAKMYLATKVIGTFEKLRAELVMMYRVRRTIADIKDDWKNCRQKPNESVAQFSQRFIDIMRELIDAYTRAARFSKYKRKIPKLIRRAGLDYYIDGLRPVFKKTGDRGYPDLWDAVMRALNEERIEKHPHLAKLQCNWCGDRGHEYSNCYQRSRHERKLRYRGLVQRTQPLA